MSLILKCLGGAMMIASALPMARGIFVLLPLAFALILSGFWVATPSPAMIPLEYDEHIKAQVETPYHHIFVTDRGSGSRYLRFNRFIESQIGLLPPDYPGRSEYTKYFHLVPAFTGPLRRVCFIGAGGGIGPREFLKGYPGIVIDCVDIDPAVLDICRDYFFVPRDNPALRMVAMDGRMFLRRKGEPYDAVVLDAFTIGGRIPFHLTTLEFFRELRERLGKDGLLLMNVIGALEGPKSAITRAVHRTMAEAFGDGPAETHVFAFDVHKNWSGGLTDSRNVIFVATRAPGDPAAAARRAAELVAAKSLREDVPDFFGNRIEKTADPAALLLTDDYAPVETLPF
jgi:spermidine synthase